MAPLEGQEALSSSLRQVLQTQLWGKRFQVKARSGQEGGGERKMMAPMCASSEMEKEARVANSCWEEGKLKEGPK